MNQKHNYCVSTAHTRRGCCLCKGICFCTSGAHGGQICARWDMKQQLLKDRGHTPKLDSTLAHCVMAPFSQIVPPMLWWCRTARFCNSGAHGGQICVSWEVVEQLLKDWGQVSGPIEPNLVAMAPVAITANYMQSVLSRQKAILDAITLRTTG